MLLMKMMKIVAEVCRETTLIMILFEKTAAITKSEEVAVMVVDLFVFVVVVAEQQQQQQKLSTRSRSRR